MNNQRRTDAIKDKVHKDKRHASGFQFELHWNICWSEMRMHNYTNREANMVSPMSHKLIKINASTDLIAS